MIAETVAAESAAISAHLDRTDLLPVSAGQLDLNLFGRGDLAGGLVGGAIDYEHRATSSLSLFGEGWAGVGYGDQSGLAYGVQAGLRMRF